MKALLCLPLFLALSIPGCGVKKVDDSSGPVVIVAPDVPKHTVVDKYADKQDAAQDKAAAAVTVAREVLPANPKAADNELTVALANLPKPTSSSIAEARKRAAAGNPETYAAVLQRADELQNEILEAWGEVEREKSRNDALQQQIEANEMKQKQKAEDDRKADEQKRKQDRIDGLATRCYWLGGILIVAGIVGGIASSYIPVDKKVLAGAYATGFALFAFPLIIEKLIDRITDWPHLELAVYCVAGVVLAIGGLHLYLSHREVQKAAA